VYHTIAAGDTFGRIARQYATTAGAIEALNPGVSASRLKVGQKIRVK
jgi:LysM repeat protein